MSIILRSGFESPSECSVLFTYFYLRTFDRVDKIFFSSLSFDYI